MINLVLILSVRHLTIFNWRIYFVCFKIIGICNIFSTMFITICCVNDEIDVIKIHGSSDR